MTGDLPIFPATVAVERLTKEADPICRFFMHLDDGTEIGSGFARESKVAEVATGMIALAAEAAFGISAEAHITGVTRSRKPD